MLGEARVVEVDAEPRPVRRDQVAVAHLDHAGRRGRSSAARPGARAPAAPSSGTHMPSWTWAATATGPEGTACGRTPAWNASASAQIFFTCVMPPAMPTSGRTKATPGRSRYSANSQIVVLRSPAATGTSTFAANARSAATLSGGIGSSTNSGRRRASSRAEQDGVAGGHVAVQLDAEVDVPADGLADRGEARDEVVDPARPGASDGGRAGRAGSSARV